MSLNPWSLFLLRQSYLQDTRIKRKTRHRETGRNTIAIEPTNSLQHRSMQLHFGPNTKTGNHTTWLYLNWLSECISFPCLPSIHSLSLLYFLRAETFALDSLYGPKIRTVPRSENYDMKTSSQTDAAFQWLIVEIENSQFSTWVVQNLGQYQTAESLWSIFSA